MQVFNDSPRGYLGAKNASGLAQAIIGLMPPHDTYIETHLGTGVILKKKPRAGINIGVEVDPQVITDYWISTDYSLDVFDCVDRTDKNDCIPGGVVIYNCPAERFIVNYDFTGSELVYCDPPYLQSTRGKARYRFDYSGQQHIDLLELLKTLPCSVMISGYPSKLYEAALPDWNTFEMQSMTRGGVRTEKLWFNFEPGERFCSDYAGTCSQERQRIKRKAKRWATRYKNMEPDERQAVFNELLKTQVVLKDRQP